MNVKTVTSLFLFVIAPTILSIFYYFFLASSQYVVQASYVIQTSGQNTSDVLGSVIGIPGQSGDARSSYIAQTYVQSTELLKELDKELNIRKLYSNPQYDWLARLQENASFYDFHAYWTEHVQADFNAISGITTLMVTSFEAESALVIAQELLKKTEQHVNRLSERARQDSLDFARRELENSETKLINARAELTGFREKRKEIDPARSSEAKVTIVSELESALSVAEAELNTVKSYMTPNAIKVKTLRNKVDALRLQIANEKKRWVDGKLGKQNSTFNKTVSDYEKLVAKKLVAERLYESALASMESARLNAIQQHKYLEVISSPQLPDEAEKPDKLENTLTVLIGSLLIWAIGSLVVSAIRDHI